MCADRPWQMVQRTRVYPAPGCGQKHGHAWLSGSSPHRGWPFPCSALCSAVSRSLHMEPWPARGRSLGTITQMPLRRAPGAPPPRHGFQSGPPIWLVWGVGEFFLPSVVSLPCLSEDPAAVRASCVFARSLQVCLSDLRLSEANSYSRGTGGARVVRSPRVARRGPAVEKTFPPPPALRGHLVPGRCAIDSILFLALCSLFITLVSAVPAW